MFTHFFGDSAHADTGEVVDGETSVASVVEGKDAFEAGSKKVIF
jgi:hypothetical protein